ncbi:hypothetical protein [Streptomyces sp. NPDC096132]|uniref:hypothetical protein n=1 Tax=Streptomyces sp. NPDC096132 TaxID=3366075 RepID=UPI003813E109
MGNAYYEITRQDGTTIEAGYGVEAVCEQDGCFAEIDRGLAHLCGNEPGGDEYGCGGYFCASHLFLGSGAPVSEGLCGTCSERYEREHPDPEEAAEDSE